MVYREFAKLKFRRTYIGGSKRCEQQIFNDIQGTKEDNSECDWLEYRRILTQYLDDVLNIILSWKYIFGVLQIVFIVIAILVSTKTPSFSIPILVISFIFHLLFLYFRNSERKKLSEYNFSLDIILAEINKETGFNLTKN
jgi:hypothetical protein